MRRFASLLAVFAVLSAETAIAKSGKPVKAPAVLTPSEIAATAPASDWIKIAPFDLLVMDLVPDEKGNARRVVIQLVPAPFSQKWVGNIRKLADAHWWDGTSINRVQDDYVVQWGDASEKKKLPHGLAKVPERFYVSPPDPAWEAAPATPAPKDAMPRTSTPDPYVPGGSTLMREGWPYATDGKVVWPVHCYAVVGVARALPPDTGSGAELFAVIGHAPRQLDRNIAVIGRVIEGIQFLSTLPRGTAALGFYEKPEQRVQIASIRIGDAVPDLPRYEYLSTESASFARYADARANRRDPFFVQPAGGADICNVPIPVRRVPAP